MDPVVHFEIPADDLARAQKFYASAFGWSGMPWGDEYVLVGTTPVDENQMPKTPGAINGGLAKRGGSIKTPTITIGVPDIDSAVKRITEAGGKLVEPKKPVGDLGSVAYFRDPEGNVIGLWESAKP